MQFRIKCTYCRHQFFRTVQISVISGVLKNLQSLVPVDVSSVVNPDFKSRKCLQKSNGVRPIIECENYRDV